MESVLWLPNGNSRISIKFHCNFEMFFSHSTLDDHPGFRAPNELFVFAGKRFPFERLILIRMDSQPACQKIIEITHTTSLERHPRGDHTAGFQLVSYLWVYRRTILWFETVTHIPSRKQVSQLEFSGVSSAEWDAQPLHNNLKFIKSFRSVPRHKSLNSNVNNH